MQPEISIESFEIYAKGLDHPECCAFDGDGVLWAGGEAGQIYKISGDGGVEEVANVGTFCAGIAFSSDQVLHVCAPALGIVRIERNGKHSVFADACAGRKIREANFLVFDRNGYLYATDSGEWKGNVGRLMRFSPDGRGIDIATGFGYANGLALSLDENEIFMVESDTDSVHRIELLDGGARSGTIQVYAENIGHLPDGLCLDAEGNLLVTSYGSHEILSVDKQRNVSLVAHDPIGVMLGNPTNVTFGGKNYDEIYVANLARWAITRAWLGRKGMPLVNLRNTACDKLGSGN
jgi:gluconolactonase